MRGWDLEGGDMTTSIPDRTEAAEYYFKYIDQVGEGPIVEILMRQRREAQALFERISEDRSTHRYAADKWAIREVLAHLNDTERLFVFRAFWFARGFDSPLPSFDQEVANTQSGANERNWTSHVDEFQAVRAATIAFFDNLPDQAWGRRGIASDNPFSVRALAYICAGHTAHHLKILEDRYL
jgi:hypothetical protein